MAVNYNGTQINQSATVVEEAGAAITDVRNKIMKIDTGKAVVATSGAAPLLGVAIVEAGANDITGAESGKIASGDDIDIQIKDIAVVQASAAIAKGAEVTATTGGLAVTASAGDYVLGYALEAAAAANDYIPIQITKYQKNPSA